MLTDGAAANGGGGGGDSSSGALARRLLEVAELAEGFSGRALRKLPFLAHAGGGGAAPLPDRCSALEFVAAMRAAVERERADRSELSTG
jgi:glucose-6-phosphate isomerase